MIKIKSYLIIIILIFLFQTSTFSKIYDENDFNHKYLSDYLLALIFKNNQNSKDSLKYFNSSKILINKHNNYLKNYTTTLVIDGQVKKSIDLIKRNKNKENSNFFEAKVLLIIDNIKKKKI